MALPMTDLPLPPNLAGPDPLPAQALERYLTLLSPPQEVEQEGGSEEEPEQRELTAEQVEEMDSVARWAIGSEGEAEWAMRHLRGHLRRRAEVKAQADEWRAQIDQWERGEVAKLLPSLEFFAGRLEAYGLAVRKADPDRATIDLPSGAIKTTSSGARVTVEDDRLAGLWLAENLEEVPEALCKWTAKVYVGPLRKLLVVAEEEVEVGTDEESGDPVTELRRYAVPPMNPATGEAWPDEVPLAERAVPGVVVEPPGISVKVAPRL